MRGRVQRRGTMRGYRGDSEEGIQSGTVKGGGYRGEQRRGFRGVQSGTVRGVHWGRVRGIHWGTERGYRGEQ